MDRIKDDTYREEEKREDNLMADMISNNGSQRLGSQFLDAQSSNTDGNLLNDKNDSDFVKDQI